MFLSASRPSWCCDGHCPDEDDTGGVEPAGWACSAVSEHPDQGGSQQLDLRSAARRNWARGERQGSETGNTRTPWTWGRVPALRRWSGHTSSVVILHSAKASAEAGQCGCWSARLADQRLGLGFTRPRPRPQDLSKGAAEFTPPIQQSPQHTEADIWRPAKDENVPGGTPSRHPSDIPSRPSTSPRQTRHSSSQLPKNQHTESECETLTSA